MAAAPEAAEAPAGGRWPPVARLEVTDPGPPPSTVSTLDLLMLVVADGSGLVRSEAALARRETLMNVSRIVGSGVLIAAGSGALLLGAALLLVAAIVALAALIGLLWAVLAVAGVSMLAGLLLVARGRHRIAHAPVLPHQSLGRISRDLEAIARRREEQQARIRARKEGSNDPSPD